MHIAKEKHVFKTIFTPTFVATATSERFCVVERAKKYVPQRNIGEVIGVMPKLVVNAMRFWSLKDEANPRWRSDVPVIKELPNCDQDRVVTRRADAAAEYGVNNQ